MKLTDLHNHTTFSYDGQNSVDEIIKNAAAAGVNVVGICDHQFSIGDDILNYIDTVTSAKARYSHIIEVKCGIEIGTRPKPHDLILSTLKKLDYCLFECLDNDTAMDLYEFGEWIKLFDIPKGLAHTDIFKLSQKYDIDIFKFMKDNNLFWEINTSGNYTYYYDFLTNPKKQRLVSESKIPVSIGSDTHWINDFQPKKLLSVHELVKNLGNPIIFS